MSEPLGAQEREYEHLLTRHSTAWGRWEEYSQVRRPAPDRYEFRRSSPLGMGTALVLAGFALNAAFLGWFLPHRSLPLALAALALAGLLFPIGRHVIVDGTRESVRTCWGTVPRPLSCREIPFSSFRAVRIIRKLGPKSGQANVGRTVRRLIYLEARNGRLLLLKPCLWINGTRMLAASLGQIVNIPVVEDDPNDSDATF